MAFEAPVQSVVDASWSDLSQPVIQNESEIADSRGVMKPFATTVSLPDDVSWEGLVAPSLNGTVLATCEYHGKLVLAGSIRNVAGGRFVGGLVLWNGTTFETLPPIDAVDAVTVWQDRLCAVVFRAGSNPTAYDILQLNGPVWDTLGTANGAVRALGVFGANLVAVGAFSAVNGVPTARVATFDGTSWAAVGAGLVGDAECLTTHQARLVVGGQLSSGTSVVSVQSWNPTSGIWEVLGNGLNARVRSLVSFNGMLLAGGQFTASGTTPVAQNAIWNGVQWSQLGPSVSGVQQFVPMTPWNGGVVIRRSSGASQLMFWNGASLTALSDSLGGGTPTRLGTFGTQLVVAGSFLTEHSRPMPNLALYDGNSWATVQEPWTAGMFGPSLGSGQTLLVWGDKLVLGGSWGIAADTDHWTLLNGMGFWNGVSWSGSPFRVSGSFRALGTYQNDLIAGGFNFTVAGSTLIRRVARWNGTQWTAMGDLGAPASPDDFREYKGQLYVAHETFGDPAGISRWDGTGWELLGNGVTLNGSPGAGLGLSPTPAGDSLVLAGRFDHAGAIAANNIVAWDGATWHALGAGFDDFARAVVVWNGRLIAGGFFTHSGATALPGCAMWNGASWEPMGTNVVSISWLYVDAGVLFGSGSFRLPDNTVIRTTARWTGTDWRILGSGGTGGGLAVHGGYLYTVAGPIENGQVTHGLVRIPLASTLDVPAPRAQARGLRVTFAPNPSRATGVCTFTLPSAQHARVSVIDVSGREIAVLANGVHAAGSHRASWAAGNAAPGVYFARLITSAGESRTTRFVVLGR